MALTVAALEALAFERLVQLGSLTVGGCAAISPDGRHLYSQEGQDIHVIERDTSTGELTLLGSVLGLGGPGCPAVSSDGEHVYTATATGPVVFDRDPSDGSITQVQSAAGANMSDVRLSPDGAQVYVTDFDLGTEVYARDALTGMLTLVQTIPEFVSVLSSDGLHAYGKGPGDDVYVLDRDPVTGALTLVATQSLDGAQPVLSPDGLHLYVVNSGGRFTAYDRDAGTGLLTKAFKLTHPFGFGTSLIITADGSRAFWNAWFEATIVFDRDAVTGELVVHDARKPDLRRLVVSPDGGHVYGQDGNGGPLTGFGFTDATCSPTPAVGCVAAEKSLLKIADKPETKRDKLVWKWAAVTGADDSIFGDVRGENDYALCAYDASASPQPVVERIAPAGSDCGGPFGGGCWQPLLRGERYSDKLTRDGLLKVSLLANAKTSVRASGRGDRVDPPALPLTLPMTVQLQNAEGLCWEATYASALVNLPGVFKAKLP